jgi:hypothetical protein
MTLFRRYRGRRFPFSYFALPDTFSTVPRASCPVFMFCAPRLIFGGRVGVGYRFHVLRSGIHFRRYRVRRVPFSYFAPHDPFSAVPRALGSVFMFCAPGRVFGGTEGVVSCFHVLRGRTRFRRYRWRRVPFSCFALHEPFSAVPTASGPVLTFRAPGLMSGVTDCVGSRFHVSRSRTHFRRYRRRRVLISCFTLRESFSVVSTASVPVFMFYAPGPVFSATNGVGSCFRVLRFLTRFRRYRRRRVPFSCFALPDSFSAVPRSLCPVFMFCAP